VSNNHLKTKIKLRSVIELLCQSSVIAKLVSSESHNNIKSTS